MSNTDNVHSDTFDKSASVEAKETEIVQPETAPEQSENEAAVRIAALEAELASMRDQLYRRAADYENLKKRQDRERIQLFQSARIDAVKQFLAVNDDLIRTLSASASMQVQPVSFLEGVQMIASKFSQVLSSYNVELIQEEGVAFNVELHDAMMRQPAPEGMEENRVLRVLEPGYKMGDTVIRHAKVIVTQ